MSAEAIEVDASTLIGPAMRLRLVRDYGGHISVQATEIRGTRGCLFVHPTPYLGFTAVSHFTVTHGPSGCSLCTGLRDPVIAAECGQAIYQEFVRAGIDIERQDLGNGAGGFTQDFIARVCVIRDQFCDELSDQVTP